MSERPYAVGMIGLGTVGSGVLELLGRRASDLERRLLRPIDVRRIAVRDVKRSRPPLTACDDTVEFLRLEYDVSAVVEKVRQTAELHDFLGLRLLEGR